MAGGSLFKKLAMRFFIGTSHIVVPFPALRLAEARSGRGMFLDALDSGILGIPPGAGARVRDPQRVDWNRRAELRAICFLRGTQEWIRPFLIS
jgi:hypothetical protein